MASQPAIFFDVSHGFLPFEPSAEEFSDPIYQPWDHLIKQLPALIRSKSIQSVVRTLPLLNIEKLRGEAEFRRAYVVLCFLSHAYIWSSTPPKEQVLPPTLTIPLLEISVFLEVPPVTTYAALTLWNFTSTKTGSFELDDIRIHYTFTGTIDEAWFYAVSIAIEERGNQIIPLMLSTIQSMRNKDYLTAKDGMHRLANHIDGLCSVLGRMYDKCDPDVFYHQIRPFLQGTYDPFHLPNGVYYAEGKGSRSWKRFRGGSNGQSSLFRFLDITLGIEHGSNHFGGGSFFQEMMEYMPGPHRRFLDLVSRDTSLKTHVMSSEDTDQGELLTAFRRLITQMTSLRDKHLVVVARYITIPSQQSGDKHQGSEGLRGTGNTLLMPFLKQSRNETELTGNEGFSLGGRDGDCAA
ncbi:indoleamine-dioxygenase [Colletotrichum truncatum]|uniref:Indoleamine-dioxygenase n=1 Tax=Colletotrichum truncatum TaxID=5467 RepID=A0ACC3YCK3_COLTU|nr:indoleamine-dioxygenase [Colletotrichum truncatum]KAF6794012.1 indoleamine-dioxygenase [Colletotrichum truncatum]